MTHFTFSLFDVLRVAGGRESVGRALTNRGRGAAPGQAEGAGREYKAAQAPSPCQGA